MVLKYCEAREDVSRTEKYMGIAEEYWMRRMQQKVFYKLTEVTMLLKNRNKHSIMSKIMFQWRCFLKEKKLLNKYLNECNYNASSK
jgi:hypothetical protein